MRLAVAFMLAVALAACGADGEPLQPAVNSSVTQSNHGMSVGTQAGLRQGPFALSLGLGS